MTMNCILHDMTKNCILHDVTKKHTLTSASAASTRDNRDSLVKEVRNVDTKKVAELNLTTL